MNIYQLINESLNPEFFYHGSPIQGLKESKSIIITGLSGSGKTTISKKMVDQYKMKFISIDDLVGPLYKKESEKEMTDDNRIVLFQTLAVNVILKLMKSSNLKNCVAESSNFLSPKVYNALFKFTDNKNNKLILVDTPIDVIIKRRTEREIKRKEKRLGRKLTNQEIEKKYQNSHRVTNALLPQLKLFKIKMKGRYETIKN